MRDLVWDGIGYDREIGIYVSLVGGQSIHCVRIRKAVYALPQDIGEMRRNMLTLEVPSINQPRVQDPT